MKMVKNKIFHEKKIKLAENGKFCGRKFAIGAAINHNDRLVLFNEMACHCPSIGLHIALSFTGSRLIICFTDINIDQVK